MEYRHLIMTPEEVQRTHLKNSRDSTYAAHLLRGWLDEVTGESEQVLYPRVQYNGSTIWERKPGHKLHANGVPAVSNLQIETLVDFACGNAVPEPVNLIGAQFEPGATRQVIGFDVWGMGLNFQTMFSKGTSVLGFAPPLPSNFWLVLHVNMS